MGVERPIVYVYNTVIFSFIIGEGRLSQLQGILEASRPPCSTAAG